MVSFSVFRVLHIVLQPNCVRVVSVCLVFGIAAYPNWHKAPQGIGSALKQIERERKKEKKKEPTAGSSNLFCFFFPIVAKNCTNFLDQKNLQAREQGGRGFSGAWHLRRFNFHHRLMEPLKLISQESEPSFVVWNRDRNRSRSWGLGCGVWSYGGFLLRERVHVV